MCKRINRLLQLGVDVSKINQMKSEKPLPYPDSTLYSLEEGSNEQIFVPVCKIKGGYRIESELSWLDNFICIGEGLKGKKIDDLLNSIEKHGLESYIRSFQIDQPQSDAIFLEYFNNLDGYFVSSGGNHRIVIAKMIGMQTIKARVSRSNYQKELEEEKHVLNWRSKKLREEIEEITRHLSFTDCWTTIGDTEKLKIFYKKMLIYDFSIRSVQKSSIITVEDLNEAYIQLEKLERIIEITKLFPKILLKILLAYLSKNENYRWIIQTKIKQLNEVGYFK
ncbi:hypothetical protein COJ23_26580 [Priestia megaterium]|uniref:hypothetical protein n=1 Tax=Priestia megaterium TaxID=1404 RepID=UPI000BF6D1EA|nr:hypothetical protein [Priestia megaterium]PFK42074.1 hypothetical protein COJ23_26580 [Priestia megaterium]